MFKKIYVEITNICNKSCSFCSPVTRKKEFMPLSQFQYVIEQIKPYCSHIYLHVKGEPLMHPDISDILKVCAESSVLVDITTNGTLLMQNKDLLIRYPVRQINISLHSFNGEENYLQDICDFAKEITTKTKTVVVMRQWVNSFEGDEIKIFLNTQFDTTDIKVERSQKLADNIYLRQGEEFDWPNLEMPHISNRGFCYGTRSHIAILVDGTVVPCCLDCNGIIDLGNIFKDKFSEIVKSERLTNMAKGFDKWHAKEELCRKCTYKERFK